MDIDFSVRRESHFWNGVTPEAVGEFLKALRQYRQRFIENDRAHPRLLRLSDTQRNELSNLFEEEICLGEFYFELRGKRKEQGFDTWVFTPAVERQSQWKTPKADVWTRSNGRVKAEIELDRTRTMTRVSMRLSNDSDRLVFYTRNSRGEVSHRFRKNEQRIEAEVQLLRKQADEVLRDHLVPTSDARKHALLQKLLLLAES